MLFNCFLLRSSGEKQFTSITFNILCLVNCFSPEECSKLQISPGLYHQLGLLHFLLQPQPLTYHFQALLCDWNLAPDLWNHSLFSVMCIYYRNGILSLSYHPWSTFQTVVVFIFCRAELWIGEMWQCARLIVLLR